MVLQEKHRCDKTAKDFRQEQFCFGKGQNTQKYTGRHYTLAYLRLQIAMAKKKKKIEAYIQMKYDLKNMILKSFLKQL